MAPGFTHSGGYLTLQKGGWWQTVIVPEAISGESPVRIILVGSVVGAQCSCAPHPPSLACMVVLLVSPPERRVRCVPDPTSAGEEPEGAGGGGRLSSLFSSHQQTRP